MPRIKESDNQTKDNYVRAYIAKNQAFYNMSDEDVAMKIHCTRQTFQNKKRRPATFTLGELRRLCECLKLADDEKIKFL